MNNPIKSRKFKSKLESEILYQADHPCLYKCMELTSFTRSRFKRLKDMSERRLFFANGNLGDCRSFGRSLCFQLKKLLEYKREQKCSSQSSDYGCWQEPPEEILEMILQNLRLSDRIRLSILCKSWRSVVMSSSSTHEFPWLVLPQSPDCSNNKTLSFFSLSDGKVVDLKLPKPVQGGWFYGSSKGWLIMIKERGLNTEVFLLNPISGALHQLPSLATIPSFQKFVEKESWKLHGASLFFNQVVLSTSNIYSDQCVVAAVLDSYEKLGLCRPGGKTWSVFCDLDHEHDRYNLSQILFSSGKLYVLIHTKIQRDMIVARTLRFGDHATLELMMVYDSIIEPVGEIKEYRDHKVYLQHGYSRFLLESTNNEVLLIHKMHDILQGNDDMEEEGNDDNDVEGNDEEEEEEEEEEEDDILQGNEMEDDNDVEGNDDEDDNNDEEEDDIQGNDDMGEEGNDDDDVEGNDDEGDDMEEEEDEGNDDNDEEDDDDDEKEWDMYARTSSFKVYKIDSQDKTSNFLPVPSLGDQVLFLAYDGSLSLSSLDLKESEKNCIYFATKSTGNNVIPKPLTSREIGVFYLDSGKIIKSFPSLNFSTRSRTSWYIPTYVN